MLTEQSTPNADVFNFAHHLMKLNSSRGGRVAYTDDYGSITYADLFNRVQSLGSALKEKGLRREERVLLVHQDSVDWVIAFLGCLYAGVVPVAVNTLLSADDYAYMIEHCRAQGIFTNSELLPTVAQALSKLSNTEIRFVCASNPAHAKLPEAKSLIGSHSELELFEIDSLYTRGKAASSPCQTKPDDPGFWLYSSGSTGKPKGTVHTHANLYWTCELYAKQVLGLRESDVCFSAAKLFFAYGLGNALSFPLSVGASTVLMAERPTPDAVFKRFKAHRPTVFFGAPTGYAGMLAHSALPKSHEVSLRMCSSAGEALPKEIGEKWTAHFNCEIIDGIGSTEMLHIYLSNRPGDVRYGTTGKPVAGYAIELRDEAGQAVAPGEIGDLYVNGPSAALFYWNNREKSRETFQGAWTKSGDKYTCDADGYYTYAGRNDDMLKVSGIYVSPFEVEATLLQHPSVLEAAVIGVEDQDGLTKTKAFVVLKSNQHATDSELQAFVKSKLAPFKYPRVIEFIQELPKTATGKIQRFKLREKERSNSQSKPY